MLLAASHALKLCGWRWPAGKRSAQTFFKQWSAVLGALVLCHQAEQLPVLRRVRSTKFFSLFAHKGGDRQWSEAELPVAGEGASLLYIGALVLKGAMVGGAGMFVGAKAVLRFRGSLMVWGVFGCIEAAMP